MTHINRSAGGGIGRQSSERSRCGPPVRPRCGGLHHAGTRLCRRRPRYAEQAYTAANEAPSAELQAGKDADAAAAAAAQARQVEIDKRRQEYIDKRHNRPDITEREVELASYQTGKCIATHPPGHPEMLTCQQDIPHGSKVTIETDKNNEVNAFGCFKAGLGAFGGVLAFSGVVFTAPATFGGSLVVAGAGVTSIVLDLNALVKCF